MTENPLRAALEQLLWEAEDGYATSPLAREAARAALAAPVETAPEQATDYRLIAHLIGTIFFAGDFKAETENERQLEKLLVKVGRRYLSWDEVDAGNDRLAAPSPQQRDEGKDAEDAKRLRGLRELCGYVEDGSSTVLTIFQDDATKDWFVKVDGQRHYARSFVEALDAAIAQERTS